MKKSSLVAAILLVAASIGVTAVFSSQVSIKEFASNVFLTATGGFQTQKVEAATSTDSGTGTLTINGSFGTYTMTNVGNPYSEIRPLTQDEINQISITIYKPGFFSDTTVVSGAKVNQSFNLPAWTYGVRVDKMPAGWGMTITAPFSCNLSVKSGGNSSCLIGFYSQFNWLGTSATSSPGSSQRYPVTSQAEQGPAAVLPQANNNLATVGFQKVFLDVTNSATTSPFFLGKQIYSTKVFNYGGKKYLLAVEGESANTAKTRGSISISQTTHILTYGLSNPLSPVLLKDNIMPSNFVNVPLISLDNYKYLFVTTGSESMNSIKMNVFQFDPSGAITFVNSYPNMSADYLFSIKNKIYAGIFYYEQSTNPPTKTYPGDPVAAGTGTINVGNGEDVANGTTRTIADWTNPILFYDVTTNLDFSDSNIISGYRHKLSSSQDASEFFRSPDLNSNIYNGSPVYADGNSSYLVTEWYRYIHRTHSSSDNLTVLDISNISNPKVVIDKPLSDILGTTKDNTQVENTCLDNDGRNYPIFSLSNGKMVIVYKHRPADLALFDTTGCYIDSQRPDGGFLIRFARVRDGVIGFDISDGNGALNFNEMPNSRQVLSECSGSSSGMGPGNCGSDVRTVNFGNLLAFNNGLLIGSQEKIALVGDNNGFSYMDASAEFKKFVSNIATTNPYTYLSGKLPTDFTNASLYQIDPKTFALYVGMNYHLQVMKISLNSSVYFTTSNLTNYNSTNSRNYSTTTLQGLQQSLFSFQNLLNVFKRIYSK